MSKKIAILALSSSLLLLSCSNNETNTNQAAGASETPLSQEATPVLLNPSENDSGASTSVQVNPVAATPVQEVQAPAKQTAQVKLNPAHGEPGHRCEIPVGAPLDGSAQTAPVQTAQPNVTVQQAPATTTVTNPPSNNDGPRLNVSPNSGTSNAKLNPAHGEPGHRCDIPVGAPLTN